MRERRDGPWAAGAGGPEGHAERGRLVAEGRGSAGGLAAGSGGRAQPRGRAWRPEGAASTHSSVLRPCARPASGGRPPSPSSSSHWLSLLLRKSSRARAPRMLLALG